MNEIDKLIDETVKFFQKYWNIESVGYPPQWSKIWKFRGTIPNYDKCGCYALLKDKNVIYIGVSVSNIAGRTSSYTRVKSTGYSNAERPYVPVEPWSERGLSGILTIGFEKEEHKYIALALESYLISKLQPKYNNRGKLITED